MSLTKDIQTIICKAEIQKGNIVAENFNYFFTGELDVVSVSGAGYVKEFEIKVSRADFKADAKKKKWYYFDIRLTPTYIPNYFSYVCPAGMIKEDELKPYVGLIYIDNDTAIVIRKPKLIHKWKHNLVKLLTKISTVNNWNHYFGAQKLTLLNREIIASNDEAAKAEFTQRMAHVSRQNI